MKGKLYFKPILLSEYVEPGSGTVPGGPSEIGGGEGDLRGGATRMSLFGQLSVDPISVETLVPAEEKVESVEVETSISVEDVQDISFEDVIDIPMMP